MAVSEIEIFNTDGQRAGSVSVRADMTAADFWAQVHSKFVTIYTFIMIVACVQCS